MNRFEWRRDLRAGNRAPLSIAIVMALVGCTAPAAQESQGPSATLAAPTAASAAPSAATSPESPHASNAPPPAPTAPAEPPLTVALSIEGDAPQFITRRGSGFVALGAEHIWTSEDGLAWDASATSGPDGTVVRIVEREDGTLIAFGYAGELRSTEEFRTWASSDGRTWQAADVGLPAAFIFLDIGRGDRGYALVGRTLLDDASPEQLWFSSDAETWELVYSTSDNESLSAVGAGPEGFVAVGQQGFRTGPSRAFVMASADGRQWIKAGDGGVLADAGSLWSVVPHHADWVTSPLTVGTELPFLWSPNGLVWEERASLGVEREDSGVIVELMSDGARLFAAVSDGGGGPMSSGLLTSTDAIEWSPTEVPITNRWNFASAGGVAVFLVDGVLHLHRE